MIRRQVVGLWGGLVLVLAVVNIGALGKERLRAHGKRVLLPLATVDPRSLMQGDYMRLRYALEREITRAQPNTTDGTIVVGRDQRDVAHFRRLARPGEPLGPGERVLRYRWRRGSLRVGPDAFFFQEGRASHFASARYGELRVDAAGDTVLIGLCDAEGRPL